MTIWRGDARQSRLEKAGRLLRSFLDDPLVVFKAFPGEFRQRYGSDQYAASQIDEDWCEHLHNLLGAPWPCPEDQCLDMLMTQIAASLTAKGFGFGRDAYAWYADAEVSLCRAAWCVVRHSRPDVIIETGVAHGVTSRVVLEALRLNDAGHLWSIDLPFPFDQRLHAQTGAAVTDECRARWSYLEGSSRQLLPDLVPEVGHVDLFIHDSLHTARNTAFEMEQAARGMATGGVMLVDDIRMHRGFTTFARRHPDYQTIVCPQSDRIGLFGIADKASRAA